VERSGRWRQAGIDQLIGGQTGRDRTRALQGPDAAGDPVRVYRADRGARACRTDERGHQLGFSGGRSGIVVAIGRTDAEARRRAAPLRVPSALPPEDPVIGSLAQLVERIGEFAATGTTRVHLRLIDMADLDHLELIAAEVLPYLEGER
jgi:hypothetical protein